MLRERCTPGDWSMLTSEPSRTAIGAAAHRATHQLLENGAVFRDPLALSILGLAPEELLKRAEEQPNERGLRFFIAARSALAEAKFAEAVHERHVEQLVIIGAGLDTFAYRNPFADAVRTFELDHPASQSWKLERLRAAKIAIPASVTFVPVDLEHATLTQALSAAGFSFEKRSFFIWLGTVPYLTQDSIEAILRTFGELPAGADIVFDYAEPLVIGSPSNDRFRDLADRVAAIGEPFMSLLPSDVLQAIVRSAGFEKIEDYNVRDLAERHWGAEAVEARARAGTPIPNRGGHVVFASTC